MNINDLIDTKAEALTYWRNDDRYLLLRFQCYRGLGHLGGDWVQLQSVYKDTVRLSGLSMDNKPYEIDIELERILGDLADKVKKDTGQYPNTDLVKITQSEFDSLKGILYGSQQAHP